MKFCIAVCILGLMAYHEALGQTEPHFPALLEGNCTPAEVPKNMLEDCWRVECTITEQGKIDIGGLPCPLAQCPNGKELGHGPMDLTKKFPDCCGSYECD